MIPIQDHDVIMTVEFFCACVCLCAIKWSSELLASMVPAVASHTYTLLGAVTEGWTKTDDQTYSVVLHSKIHNDAWTQSNSVQTTGQVCSVDHGKPTTVY